jgi:hypothetical protein
MAIHLNQPEPDTSAVELVKILVAALEAGKMCCGILLSEGGAAACELSENEYPQILRALKEADAWLGEQA